MQNWFSGQQTTVTGCVNQWVCLHLTTNTSSVLWSAWSREPMYFIKFVFDHFWSKQSVLENFLLNSDVSIFLYCSSKLLYQGSFMLLMHTSLLSLGSLSGKFLISPECFCTCHLIVVGRTKCLFVCVWEASKEKWGRVIYFFWQYWGLNSGPHTG
jgi:hypothetical protein